MQSAALASFTMAKKIKGFQDFHENALVQSFKMSSQLIRLVFRSKSLSWAAPSRPDPEMLAIIGFCTTLQTGAHFDALEWYFFCHFETSCHTVT